ncbi:hypothetical protein GOP47_0001425 [Adiantum capillus-veneris]|uniref:Uncharacterized protein n=1 Tax=Adiantum capillus-veneris TaxID=13818 RepID=A0A9D4ZQ04_ADICA|nr:hypothetical protein GOP47_0001425 [Adiantum capillus-veneris]
MAECRLAMTTGRTRCFIVPDSDAQLIHHCNYTFNVGINLGFGSLKLDFDDELEPGGVYDHHSAQGRCNYTIGGIGK